MEIKSLPQPVRVALRSGITITTVSQAVSELVLNSIDANATSIAIRLNLRTYRIQVIDNGTGMTKQNLVLAGMRFMTSKCRTMHDLKTNLKKFGFRGEALASLRCMSERMIVTSRHHKCENTYRKTFKCGKSIGVVFVSPRASKGTSVTIEGFMYNVPVRQRRIDYNLDIEEVKRTVEAIALIHPQMSFTIRNDIDNEIIFDVRKSKSICQRFLTLFGTDYKDHMGKIDHQIMKIKIRGFICKQTHCNAKMQFVYVNKRNANDSEIHKFINDQLGLSNIFKIGIRQPNKALYGEFLTFSPLEKNNKNCIYVLNIKCPTDEIDVLTYSTNIQFHNRRIYEALEKCLREFLIKEKLIDDALPAEEEKKCMEQHKAITISKVQGAVKSRPAKRKLPPKRKANKKIKMDILSQRNAIDLPDGKPIIMNAFLKSTAVYPPKKKRGGSSCMFSTVTHSTFINYKYRKTIGRNGKRTIRAERKDTTVISRYAEVHKNKNSRRHKKKILMSSVASTYSHRKLASYRGSGRSYKYVKTHKNRNVFQEITNKNFSKEVEGLNKDFTLDFILSEGQNIKTPYIFGVNKVHNNVTLEDLLVESKNILANNLCNYEHKRIHESKTFGQNIKAPYIFQGNRMVKAENNLIKHKRILKATGEQYTKTSIANNALEDFAFKKPENWKTNNEYPQQDNIINKHRHNCPQKYENNYCKAIKRSENNNKESKNKDRGVDTDLTLDIILAEGQKIGAPRYFRANNVDNKMVNVVNNVTLEDLLVESQNILTNNFCNFERERINKTKTFGQNMQCKTDVLGVNKAGNRMVKADNNLIKHKTIHKTECFMPDPVTATGAHSKQTVENAALEECEFKKPKNWKTNNKYLQHDNIKKHHHNCPQNYKNNIYKPITKTEKINKESKNKDRGVDKDLSLDIIDAPDNFRANNVGNKTVNVDNNVTLDDLLAESQNILANNFLKYEHERINKTKTFGQNIKADDVSEANSAGNCMVKADNNLGKHKSIHKTECFMFNSVKATGEQSRKTLDDFAFKKPKNWKNDNKYLQHDNIKRHHNYLQNYRNNCKAIKKSEKRNNERSKKSTVLTRPLDKKQRSLDRKTEYNPTANEYAKRPNKSKYNERNRNDNYENLEKINNNNDCRSESTEEPTLEDLSVKTRELCNNQQSCNNNGSKYNETSNKYDEIYGRFRPLIINEETNQNAKSLCCVHHHRNLNPQYLKKREKNFEVEVFRNSNMDGNIKISTQFETLNKENICRFKEKQEKIRNNENLDYVQNQHKPETDFMGRQEVNPNSEFKNFKLKENIELFTQFGLPKNEDVGIFKYLNKNQEKLQNKEVQNLNFIDSTERKNLFKNYSDFVQINRKFENDKFLDLQNLIQSPYFVQHNKNKNYDRNTETQNRLQIRQNVSKLNLNNKNKRKLTENVKNIRKTTTVVDKPNTFSNSENWKKLTSQNVFKLQPSKGNSTMSIEKLDNTEISNKENTAFSKHTEVSENSGKFENSLQSPYFTHHNKQHETTQNLSKYKLSNVNVFEESQNKICSQKTPKNSNQEIHVATLNQNQNDSIAKLNENFHTDLKNKHNNGKNLENQHKNIQQIVSVNQNFLTNIQNQIKLSQTQIFEKPTAPTQTNKKLEVPHYNKLQKYLKVLIQDATHSENVNRKLQTTKNLNSKNTEIQEELTNEKLSNKQYFFLSENCLQNNENRQTEKSKIDEIFSSDNKNPATVIDTINSPFSFSSNFGSDILANVTFDFENVNIKNLESNNGELLQDSAAAIADQNFNNHERCTRQINSKMPNNGNEKYNIGTSSTDCKNSKYVVGQFSAVDPDQIKEDIERTGNVDCLIDFEKNKVNNRIPDTNQNQNNSTSDRSFELFVGENSENKADNSHNENSNNFEKADNNQQFNNLNEKSLNQNKKYCILRSPKFKPQIASKVDLNQSEWVQQTTESNVNYYVNVRTGMTMFESPKNPDLYTFCKRPPFVPKGASPVLKITKKVENYLSPASRDVLCSKMAESISKDSNDLRVVKWINYFSEGNKESFFENLYSTSEDTFIPNICVKRLPKKYVHLIYNLTAISFSRDSFKNIHVIGQFDKKFILALTDSTSINSNLLVIFDQHAVHERIRVEKLYKRYKNEKFKSTELKNQIILTMKNEEIKILMDYKVDFENFGLKYQSNGEHTVVVTHAPLCFKNRTGSSTVQSLVENLVREEIVSVERTRKTTTSAPLVIQQAINSEACRGAIKFGEALSKHQCRKLIFELSDCDLPYQCAHGRPTVIPVLNMSSLLIEKTGKPNLSFLSKTK